MERGPESRRSGDELDRYLDSVLIGGREPVALVMTDYDSSWPTRFAELEARIGLALGDAALAVEHIGSTSVPGLAAKPIIDVLVVVADLEDEPSYVPALVDADFVLRVREAGHRMFRTPDRDAHIHVYSSGDQAITDYQDLRDWLRVDEADRTVYADVKRDLALRPWSDMNHYAEAKSDVIQQLLGRARAGGERLLLRSAGPAPRWASPTTEIGASARRPDRRGTCPHAGHQDNAHRSGSNRTRTGRSSSIGSR